MSLGCPALYPGCWPNSAREFLTMPEERPSVVWIVDDAESVRQSLAAVIEAAGLPVRTHPSAATSLADHTPPEAGYLIVDHHMPGMTGLELLQHLASRGAVPPTIVMTGQGDTTLRRKYLQAGAVDMLNKPVDGDELIALIHKMPLNSR